MQVIDYDHSWQGSVISLWETCELTRPWNNPTEDILRKLTDAMGKFVLLVDGDKLIASMMIGYDGHRGSVNYLAVLPDYQGQGVGRQLMTYCEDYLKHLGCPKINICVRDTNVQVMDFYATLGYKTDPVIVVSKRLLADN